MKFHNLTWKQTKLQAKELFHWKLGRQNTGYDAFIFILNPLFIPFHVLILRFKVGSKIPPHKDKGAKGTKHYRLNVIIRESKDGGEFKCEKMIYESRRIKFFRADLYTHEVTEVKGRTRYVFSIGWVIK